jgi:polyvinyl alcohol dehydrogenase (cytochrome)
VVDVSLRDLQVPSVVTPALTEGEGRMRKQLVLVVALVAVAAATAWVQAQGRGGAQAGPPQQAGPVTPAGMTSRFESGCAICHDNPQDQTSRAPTRETLRTFTPERVLAALTTGSMKEQGSSLSDEQKRAIAELVTGKGFGGGANRSAAGMSNHCAAPLKMDNALSRPRWNGWNPDGTTSQRMISAEMGKLTAEQVPRLKMKWAVAFPDAASVAQSQPVVVGGAIFIGTDNNFVYALDAKTGCIHWSYDAKSQVRGGVTIGEPKTTPGVRYAAYFGDMFGIVHAVNAETGVGLWTLKSDPHPGAKITGAPTMDPTGTRLFVPVASWEEQTGSIVAYECCKFQGSVVAVDVKTGKQVWKTYTMPERPQALNKKNSAGKQLFGPAGASVWNAPTLDTRKRAVYVGTGNCYITEHFENKAGFDGRACDAVVAFDMGTGKRLWTTQLLANDPDEGGCGRGPERRINCPGYIQGPGDDVNATMLATLTNGKRVLIASQESGRITALDPDNDGAVLWVAQAGDQLSPNASNPWGGASDGELFYRPLAFGDQTGAMAALRLTNGERVWYTKLPRPAECPQVGGGGGRGGPPSCNTGNNAGATAIPGAVLTGSKDGVMRAFAMKDGKIIWEFPTMGKEFSTLNGVKGTPGSFGGSGPTVIDGMVYSGSGYAIVGGTPGNMLFAWAVE